MNEHEYSKTEQEFFNAQEEAGRRHTKRMRRMRDIQKARRMKYNYRSHVDWQIKKFRTKEKNRMEKYGIIDEDM